MKQLPVFHTEALADHMEKIYEAASHRLKNLDQFCEDIKSVEKLFRSWCVPTVGPFVDGCNEDQCEGLVWNDIAGRIMYGTCEWTNDEHDFEISEFMKSEKPLIECSANVRRHVAEHLMGDFMDAVLNTVKNEKDVPMMTTHTDPLASVPVDSGMMLIVDPSYVLGRENGGLAKGKTWEDVCDALGSEEGVCLRESVGINGYLFNMPGDGFYDVVGIGAEGETKIVGIETRNDLSDLMKQIVTKKAAEAK